MRRTHNKEDYKNLESNWELDNEKSASFYNLLKSCSHLYSFPPFGGR